MADEIATFDPSSLADKLREKIKSAMLELIPDEQWNALVKKEIDDFFTDRVAGPSYDKRVIDSPFKSTVQAVIRDETKRRIDQMMHTTEWQSRWDGNKYIAGEKIFELLKTHGTDIINSWLSQIIQVVVDQMRHQMGR